MLRANDELKFVNDAGLDPDGDQMTNRAEFIAGTDPQNALSCLKVQEITNGAGGRTLRFNAMAERGYSVFYRDSMLVGNWLKLIDVATRPTNRVEIVVDTNAVATGRFYRLATPVIP